MTHDTFSINEFKQVLSQYDGRKFIFNNEKYIIIHEKLFYDDVMPRRCMWYCLGTCFTEGVKNELLRNI